VRFLVLPSALPDFIEVNLAGLELANRFIFLLVCLLVLNCSVGHRVLSMIIRLASMMASKASKDEAAE